MQDVKISAYGHFNPTRPPFQSTFFQTSDRVPSINLCLCFFIFSAKTTQKNVIHISTFSHLIIDPSHLHGFFLFNSALERTYDYTELIICPNYDIEDQSSQNIAQDHRINSKAQWQPTPVLLPGKAIDEGAWQAAVHGVAKSWTRLSHFTFTFTFVHWRRK